MTVPTIIEKAIFAGVELVPQGLDSKGREHYKTICPRHHDTDPSLILAVEDDGSVDVYCFPCGTDAETTRNVRETFVESIGLTTASLKGTGKKNTSKPSVKTKPKSRPGLLPESRQTEIVAARQGLAGTPLANRLDTEFGISTAVQDRCAIGVAEGRVWIPYPSHKAGDRRKAFQLDRWLMPPDRDDDAVKTLAEPERPRWPYIPTPFDLAAPMPLDPATFTVLTEGVRDALVALSLDPRMRVVAIPSASTFPAAWAQYIVQNGGHRIAVAVDADQAGRRVQKVIVDEFTKLGAEVRVIELPQGMDVADHVATFGTDRHAAFLDLADRMKPAATTDEQEIDGAAIDGAQLLEELVEAQERFVRFANIEQVWTQTLWVAATHAFALDCFDTAAYLAVTSAEKRSGKSRDIEVIDLLVHEPWRISSAPTISSLFRTIEDKKPTVLIDEADEMFGANGDDARQTRAALNAGYRRGATVPRMEPHGDGWSNRDYSVFCMKLLAGLRMSAWPDTTRDRCIPIELVRRMTGERVERFRHRHVAPQLHAIRDRIAAWTEVHAEELREHEAEDLPQIDDRSFECWEPLLAVAAAAGGPWPERARQAALKLSGQTQAEGDSLGVRLLRDVRDISRTAAEGGKLSSPALVAALNTLDDAPWRGFRDGQGIDAYSLNRMLSEYGVRKKNVRIDTAVVKGWDVADFADSWARYLPSHPLPSHAL